MKWCTVFFILSMKLLNDYKWIAKYQDINILLFNILIFYFMFQFITFFIYN